MVTVKVFFEGGADPRSNPNADTFDNTNRLRESFNKLLNSGFESEKVKIIAEPAYSISNFKNLIKNRQEDSLFLMDLDGTKDKKNQRLIDNELIDIQEFIFFMIQQMESWILSQPEVIEEVFAVHKKTPSIYVKNHSKIQDIHPEKIYSPEDVLDEILQKYFFDKKKLKKVKYKKGFKLKHSPNLIEKLNLQKLRNTFEDVERLVLKINEFSFRT